MSKWIIKEWWGERLVAKIEGRTMAAIDEITSTCAHEASMGRSGSRASNVTSKPARKRGSKITGKWGVFPAPKGGASWIEIFSEYGGAHNPGDNAKRNAADANYPKLAAEIRRRG